MDLLDEITAYEDGTMTEDEIISFFQKLVDIEMAWQLQGSYNRTAADLIKAGKVKQNETDLS